jgi:molybdopterin synthase sulfur carrier subunit
MTMTIFLFGRLADRLGREVELALPRPCTVADIRRELTRLNPVSAADLASSRALACINDAMVREDAVVREGDEIALFPPLSGG